jgi:hypothetical protein
MNARTAPYNTGLKRGDYSALRAQLGETSQASSPRGVVFAHAVERPLTDHETTIVSQVGCIYCELPWPQGWPVFHERAGVAPAGSYADYVAAVARLLARFAKPSFIVCSKAAAAVLAQHPARPIGLNGDRAWLAASYVEDVPDAVTTEALLTLLGGQYPSVYDFGCGYGNALHGFGFFVGSDIDCKCLDYISRTLL